MNDLFQKLRETAKDLEVKRNFLSGEIDSFNDRLSHLPMWGGVSMCSVVGVDMQQANNLIQSHLEASTIRLFRERYDNFQFPHSLAFESATQYVEAIIAEIPRMLRKEKLLAAKHLYLRFHPDSSWNEEGVNKTKRGMSFDVSSYFDDGMKRVSYGTVESVMMTGMALLTFRDELGLSEEVSLDELKGKLSMRHSNSFKRQLIQLGDVMMVTIFKSYIKLEVSFSALEAMQLIWSEFELLESA